MAAIMSPTIPESHMPSPRCSTLLRAARPGLLAKLLALNGYEPTLWVEIRYFSMLGAQGAGDIIKQLDREVRSPGRQPLPYDRPNSAPCGPTLELVGPHKRSPDAHFTSPISLGRHDLSKKGSGGLYRRRIVNQPFFGSA